MIIYYRVQLISTASYNKCDYFLILNDDDVISSRMNLNCEEYKMRFYIVLW